MGGTGAVVTLMLLYVQSSFGGIEVFPGEPFDCNNYIDYVMTEWSCRPEGLFEIPEDVMDDGVLTGEKLLEEIRVRCSNVTLVDTYMECLGDLEDECPVQSVDVLDLVNEKIGMFCDGTAVSPWLSTTLQNGYSFNQECYSVMGVLVTACAQELSAAYRHYGSNMTLTTALKVLPQAVSVMFQCTMNRFSVIPASYQDCGSSWQDMFLTTWLQLSASMGLGAHLSYDERLELQAMKTEQSD